MLQKAGLKLNSQKTKIMASGPITSCPIEQGNSGNSDRLYFLGFQNHCEWFLQPWNWKTLAPWKKAMTDLKSMLRNRDITLLIKVHILKAMAFLVLMYGCESWTIKKAKCQIIDTFELWCWRRLLRVSWTARRSNQSILNIHWKEWYWSSNILATIWEEPTL